MQFIFCFILGLLLLCTSTIMLVSCLPVFSIDALMTDNGYRYYFSISCFGFLSAWFFISSAKV